MDYGKLINRSFALAWRYKILWIFGLFTGMGSSMLDWGEHGGDSEWLRGLSGDFDQWDSSSFDIDPEMLLPLAGGLLAALLLLGLVFLIANRIATPALIDSVNSITRGGQFRFSNSFSRGIDLFWRFIGMFFVELFAWFSSMIILVPLCIILIITLIGIPVAIAVIFFAVYFWFTFFSLAERAIVARNCSIGDGLSEAWILIKTNFGSTLMMGLITLGLSIAIGLVAMIGLLMIALPFGGATWIMTDSPVAGFLIGFLISLPVGLVIGGFSGTILSSLYTLYYFELVDPTQPVQPGPPAQPATPDSPMSPPLTSGPAPNSFPPPTDPAPPDDQAPSPPGPDSPRPGAPNLSQRGPEQTGPVENIDPKPPDPSV